jgi:Tol biopolymer transport system component
MKKHIPIKKPKRVTSSATDRLCSAMPTLLLALLIVAMLSPRTALAHPSGVTERVSVDNAGNQANDASGFLSGPAISADGRFVAFDSIATNLLPEGNLPFNIFVHDRLTDTIEAVSVSSRGRQGEGSSSGPDLSEDGRFVAFDSDATNLVRGDRNRTTDVFAHDRTTGRTILVSVSSTGQQGDASSHAPAISARGRSIVFHANSSLTPEDTNTNTDVYVRDLKARATTLVSIGFDGAAGNGTSFLQDISGNGRLVAFVSSATNLIPNDVVDDDPNVYVRDFTTGTTELASVGSDGTRANVGFFDSPAISSDGRFVAFSTFDSLVPEDTRPFSLDIYLRDRQTGTTELISVNSDEVPGDGRSDAPNVSADGRFVVFQSDSTNIIPEPPTLFPDEDIFVRDRQTGTNGTGQREQRR